MPFHPDMTFGMKTHLYECEKGHLSLFHELLLRDGILQHVQVGWMDDFFHPLDLQTEIKCKRNLTFASDNYILKSLLIR